MNNYNVENIKTLEGIEAIRLRPGMYVGSAGPDGLRQIILEIISNVIDEYLNGHCTECLININEDGSISVQDNGRGIPTGINKDGMETLEAIFTKLHTGAKFDETGQSGYNTSGGMHGVGAKATNALSSTFEVQTWRDGTNHIMTFEKGIRKNYVTQKTPKKDSGTCISFTPDKEIFKEGIKCDQKQLIEQIRELSFLSPGMVFIVTKMDNTQECIKSEKGLVDYVNHITKDKTSLTSIFSCESMNERVGVKVAMKYVSSYSETYKLYTNSIPNDSGTHLTGFKTAMTLAVNNYARQNKLLKEKDANLTGDELKEGMVLILSLTMPDPVFSGQTKGVLNSPEGRTIVQRTIAVEIKNWLEKNPSDAKGIINKALLAKKAREAARKAKEKTRSKPGLIGNVLPGKLAGASSRNPEECEIFIVEGDSAAGTAKTARNRRTQAVLPVRGKIINCEKTVLSKILANEEIKSMIKAFGLQESNGKIVVDESKLRYKKIIILSDSDVDGSHIQTLFLTFIYNFAKDLFNLGYIYVALPPLYKVVMGKESYYMQDDAELASFKAKNATRKLQIQRFKGLKKPCPYLLYL